MQTQPPCATQRAQMKRNSESPDATDRSAQQFNSPRFFDSLEQLEGLLGEQVLPLFEAQSQTDPRLTVLDSRSALVVIEVCDVLDAATLTRALANAGRWSKFTRAELAQAYPNGPEQFSADLTSLLSSAPSAAGASTGQRTRLIILCIEVASDSVDAVRFLRDTGSAIEVRAVATSAVAGFQGTAAPAQPALTIADEAPERDSVYERARALAPSAPEPEPIPVAPLPTDSVAPPRASFPGGGRAHNSATGPLPTATGSSVHAAAHDGPRLRSRVIREEATDTNQIDLSRTRRAQSGDQYAAAMAYGTPDVAPTGEPAAAALPSGPRSERLAALALQLTEPAAMVWTRQRRGQRFEATLNTDGVITLADGRTFADPNAAAAAAAGTDSHVDGWRTWRLGDDDGPALAELG